MNSKWLTLSCAALSLPSCLFEIWQSAGVFRDVRLTSSAPGGLSVEGPMASEPFGAVRERGRRRRFMTRMVAGT
jgi:hypothetical protein